jgi:uncharacterized protein (DUF433 family)
MAAIPDTVVQQAEQMVDYIEEMSWEDCPLIEIDPERVSGAPVFRNTRLPVSTIIENVDAYIDEGLTLDRAIAETLSSFPSTPGGADGIRAVLAWREAHETQLQA